MTTVLGTSETVPSHRLKLAEIPISNEFNRILILSHQFESPYQYKIAFFIYFINDHLELVEALTSNK